MNERLTAVFEKSEYGYIGYIEELPGATRKAKRLPRRGKTSLKPSRSCCKPIRSGK